MASSSSSVLIIEDCANLVFLLEKFLQTLNFRTDFAYLGVEGIRKAKEEIYDLILIDIQLSDINGIRAIQNIRNHTNKPIIAISNDNCLKDEIDSYQSKVNIFHRKPINFELLEAQISGLTNRDELIKEIQSKDVTLNLWEKVLKINQNIIPLTRREFLFLELLFENSKKIFSREAIISKLMLDSQCVEIHAIDTMISRIRKKTGDHNLIRTVNGYGYKLETEYEKSLNINTYSKTSEI